jgi:alkylation response protein AidB-like acyl-CoA dehydrogenase
MQYVPELVADETVGMMSLTEIDGGSYATGAMCGAARRRLDGINGQKMWAAIANETDAGILLARTDLSRTSGIAAFIARRRKYAGFTRLADRHAGLSEALRIVYLDDRRDRDDRAQPARKNGYDSRA